VISAGIKSLKTWPKQAEQKIYFFTNSQYLIPAILFSALAVGIVAYLRSPATLFIIGFASFWLTIWSLAVAGLIYGCAKAWKAAFAGKSFSTPLAGKAFVFTLFTLPFVGGEGLGIFMVVKASSISVALFLFNSIALHILFLFLLKAPTVAGRKLLDQVEGFKMFLGAVDGDRLNRVNPPDQTPETFEKFLPYALALDVEQAWAEKFSGVLNAASQAADSGAGYSPSFYSGSNLGSFSGAGFASGFSDSFTSAISSSSSAPGSSDGGGGGGSGGGGGGGG
jgi:hypothetical protein